MIKMDFKDFSVFNRRRCEAPHGFHHQLDSWSLSDWMTAALGELGEAANVAKKLNRVRDGIPGNTETPEQLKAMLADEIADTFIYLDLLAQSQGFLIEDAVLAKFQRTSAKIGYDDKLLRRSVGDAPRGYWPNSAAAD
jgi:NTP pyrophosphatase (non-canonical NTP hydrolase)